jgi:hypothetical protein
MDNPYPGGPKSLTIKAEDDVAKGRFCNLAQVGSSPEAFVLDFAFVQGNTGWLLARMLLSPQHAKRFSAVLAETIAKYEEHFGTIDVGPTLQ